MADESKTKPATLRLTAPVVEALERYRSDREKELKRMLPGYELSQAGALASIVTGYLENLGYLPKEGQQAPEKPRAAERRKLPRGVPSAPVKIPGVNEKHSRIAADLRAGKYETQSALAEAYGLDPGQITRIKKKMERGEL